MFSVPDCSINEELHGALAITQELAFSTRGYVSRVQVMVDGVEDGWLALRSDSAPNSPFHVIGFFREDIPEILRTAEEFKIALNTRKYGKLLYNFDMTGATEAIARACPE